MVKEFINDNINNIDKSDSELVKTACRTARNGENNHDISNNSELHGSLQAGKKSRYEVIKPIFEIVDIDWALLSELSDEVREIKSKKDDGLIESMDEIALYKYNLDRELKKFKLGELSEISFRVDMEILREMKALSLYSKATKSKTNHINEEELNKCRLVLKDLSDWINKNIIQYRDRQVRIDTKIFHLRRKISIGQHSNEDELAKLQYEIEIEEQKSSLLNKEYKRLIEKKRRLNMQSI